MIDKDLDSLLSDLKNDSDFELVREGASRKNRDASRTEDQAGENDADPVRGHSNKLQAIDRIEISRVFGGGIIQAVNNHFEFCKSFRMTSLDQEANGAVEEILRQYKYTFIRSIENIEKLYEDVILVLDPRTLEKNARKDFSRYFDGFEEQNRIDFLALRGLFIELREFNSLVKKEWSELSRSIGVINLSSAGKPLYQTLNAVIESAIAFCMVTDSFLNYLAHVLAIPGRDFDLLKSEVNDKTTYLDYFSYSYGDLFNLERYTELDGTVLPELPGSEAISGVHSVPEETAGVEAVIVGGHPPGSGFSDDKEVPGENFIPEPAGAESPVAGFTVRGTRSWNTKEPYIIRLNGDRLSRDEDDLMTSFYFISEPIDERVLEGELKRGMVRFMRDPALNVFDRYGEFVLKFVFSSIKKVTDFFDVGEAQALFLYHLGPLPMYMITIDAFNSLGVGACFKYIAGKRAARILPAEFIKQKVLEWYDNAINVYNLPCDNIQEYETIRKIVTKKYYAAVDENNKKLDLLIEKSGLASKGKFDRNEVFKTKWKELFGSSNIFVYNRFIEKTIFK